MEFEVLGLGKKHKCSVALVKADIIEVKRRPNQVFSFRDVGNFLDALIGHSNVVVHVGKDSADSEKWKAYYWEPAEAKKDYMGYGGENILPLGSLAILEMENEYDLVWELENRAKETKRWIGLSQRVGELSKKIRAIDDENEYADAEQFEYMNADELEDVLEKMKEVYAGLTRKGKAEV